MVFQVVQVKSMTVVRNVFRPEYHTISSDCIILLFANLCIGWVLKFWCYHKAN